jgi:hypothetical protein
MTDIALPALGESVIEATITKWFYKVGDFVKIDTPLFEVSTDKVDTEIPAPVTGTLTAIHAQEGETVPAGFIVASIEAGADKAAPADTPAPIPAPAANTQPNPQPELDTRSQLEVDTKSDITPAPTTSPAAPLSTPPTPTVLSPVVRKLAERLDVDIAQVSASGPGGRVTRQDVEEAAKPAVKAAATTSNTSSTSTQVASTHVVSLANEQLVRSAPPATRASEGSSRSSLVHTLTYEVDVTGLENLSIPSRHAFLYSLVSALGREFPEGHLVPLGVRSVIDGTYCSLYMKDAAAWRPAHLSQMVSELSATSRSAITPAMLTPTRFNVEVTPHAAISSTPPLFSGEAFVCAIAAPRAEVKAVNGGFAVRSVATVVVVFDPQLISYAQVDAVLKDALLATLTTAWADFLH